MKRYYITILITLGLVFGVQCAAPGLQAAGLFDAAKDDACAGSQVSDTAPNCSTGATNEVDSLIQNIVDILSVIIGIIAVIMVIVNGLRFITSGGDSNAVNSARNGIIYAIVGLIIVGMAQFIVRFVLSSTS